MRAKSEIRKKRDRIKAAIECAIYVLVAVAALVEWGAIIWSICR